MVITVFIKTSASTRQFSTSPLPSDRLEHTGERERVGERKEQEWIATLMHSGGLCNSIAVAWSLLLMLILLRNFRHFSDPGGIGSTTAGILV